MDTTVVTGNWNEQKSKLKEKLVILANNDLLFEDGRKAEMLGILRIKLGMSREELQALIEAL